MNFLNILKALFRSKPSLDEFIAIHNPETAVDVENLTKQYDRLILSSSFYS